MMTHSELLQLDGQSLTLAQMDGLRTQSPRCALASQVPAQMNRSVDTLHTKLAVNEVIYGVNTLFGGMAKGKVDNTTNLQHQLLHCHNAGSGPSLATDDVRLAMVLRVNSLCKGVSGIRPEILSRYVDLINKGLFPDVRAHGSIGASGDLIPLSTIAGAALGLSDEFYFNVDGEKVPAKSKLSELGLDTLPLQAKEGLALINGTSCHTAIAINVLLRFMPIFDLTMRVHAMVAEVMQSDDRPFSAFVQNQRPHKGQKFIASVMRSLLADSQRICSHADVHSEHTEQKLAQQRYSIRCIPQFIGPIIEELEQIGRVLQIEANSATDNPLIDADNQQIFHGGNFLGQHIAVAMDKLRVMIALLAKHNEAQIAMLVEPAFSDGLPPCLIDEAEPDNIVGVKPLQICSNSLAPLIEKLADPICTRFPIHAEQFNQNVNSQAYNAAVLAQESASLYQEQLSALLLIVTRAKHLRQQQDASKGWSCSSTQLHQQVTEQVYSSTIEPSHSQAAPSYQQQMQTLQSWLNNLPESASAFSQCTARVKTTL